MNGIPRVVFSETLNETTCPTTRIARGELAAEIAAIKEEPGPDAFDSDFPADVPHIRWVITQSRRAQVGGWIDRFCDATRT